MNVAAAGEQKTWRILLARRGILWTHHPCKREVDWCCQYSRRKQQQQSKKTRVYNEITFQCLWVTYRIFICVASLRRGRWFRPPRHELRRIVVLKTHWRNSEIAFSPVDGWMSCFESSRRSHFKHKKLHVERNWSTPIVRIAFRNKYIYSVILRCVTGVGQGQQL